jgi:hypothetical protein
MVEAIDPTKDELSTITLPSPDTTLSVIDNARKLTGSEPVVDDRTGEHDSLNLSQLLFADVIMKSVDDGVVTLHLQEPSVFHRGNDVVDGWYAIEITADAEHEFIKSVTVRVRLFDSHEEPERSALEAAGDPRNK